MGGAARRVHPALLLLTFISSGICTLNSGGKAEGTAGSDALGVAWSQFSMSAGLLPWHVTDCCGSSPKSVPLGSFELGFSKVAWFPCLLCLFPCSLLGIFTVFLDSFCVLLSKQIKA